MHVACFIYKYDAAYKYMLACGACRYLFTCRMKVCENFLANVDTKAFPKLYIYFADYLKHRTWTICPASPRSWWEKLRGFHATCEPFYQVSSARRHICISGSML